MPEHAAVAAALRAAGCVFAEEEAALLVEEADTTGRDLAALVAARTSGTPLEHVLGWAELCGVRVAVDPGVFVPRRRTELLVRISAAVIAGAGRRGTAPVALDLCCGSGAIGLALAHTVGDLELHAADVDAVAVACARRNLDGVGAVHHGELLDAVPSGLRGRVDVLMACPPYVPSEAVALMPPEARDHEPRAALDGGPDGLVAARRIVAAAPGWLRAGGAVVLEVADRQSTPLATAMAEVGLTPETVTDEEIGATAVVGRLPSGREDRRRQGGQPTRGPDRPRWWGAYDRATQP